jgi:hypothetical protein
VNASHCQHSTTVAFYLAIASERIESHGYVRRLRWTKLRGRLEPSCCHSSSSTTTATI